MSKLTPKMLCDIPNTKLITNQEEVIDITASKEVPYDVNISLAEESDLHSIFPITALRKASAESNYFSAILGAEYNVEYIDSNNIIVHIYANGSYKINY